MEKYSKYASSVLRVGMAIVVLWFSVSQFIDASSWEAYVPESMVSISGLSATTLVYFNAVFELVFGLMMLFGIYTRLSALLLSLHLFDIMYVVGYGQIGVRDFGLAVATLSVYINGADVLCLDYKNKFVEAIK